MPKKPLIISFDDAYENVYLNAFPILEQYGFKAVIFVIGNYIGKKNTWDANLGGRTFLHANIEQLKVLISSGWEIGAHSMNHISFLKSQDFLYEIETCKEYLESTLNTKVHCFSYPFGTYLKENFRLIESNYNYSFLATPSRSTSPHLIGRSSVYATDQLKHLKKKINGNVFELFKLKLINLGAKATELLQRINIISGDKNER